MDVIANLGTGIDGGVAKDAALLAHLFGTIQQAADGDLAHAVKRRRLADGLLLFAATDVLNGVVASHYTSLQMQIVERMTT